MEALVDKGLVRSIGVSNFNVQLLWDMLSYARILPVCNEVELHPKCAQPKLVKFLEQNNIVPIAYCPLGRGAEGSVSAFDSPVVKSLAEKHGKTAAQIILNWGLQKNFIVIPKSNSSTRLEENMGANSFTLTPEEVEEISKLDEGARFCDPQWIGSSLFA